MKKLMAFLGVMFFVCGITGIANSSSVFLPGVSQAGGYYDVTKLWDGQDNNLCWAASSSNIVMYTGWRGGFGTANDIFNEYKFHWSNNFGHPYYGVEWWFSGVNNSPGGPPQWAYLDNPIWGGKFYSQALFNANYGYGSDTSKAMTWIKQDVDTSRGFAMLLGTDAGGIHVVTGWGYDDAKNGVWISDSDDNFAGLKWYDLNEVSNKWYVQNYPNWDNNLYIIDMFSLGMNVGNVTPNPHNPHEVVPSPEPATLLLLGSGLLGLFFLRKRI